jgi:hypothetical protein
MFVRCRVAPTAISEAMLMWAQQSEKRSRDSAVLQAWAANYPAVVQRQAVWTAISRALRRRFVNYRELAAAQRPFAA